MEVIHGGTIKKGDLIIISSDNYLSVGFYLGIGPTGSLQYYSPYTLDNWWDVITQDPNSKKKPFKSYINSPNMHRVAKFHPYHITDESYLKMYKKSILSLKKLNIL